MKGIEMWGTYYAGHRKIRISKAGIAVIIACIAVIVLIIIAALNAPDEPAARYAPDDGGSGITIAEYNSAYGPDDSSVTVIRNSTGK